MDFITSSLITWALELNDLPQAQLPLSFAASYSARTDFDLAEIISAIATDVDLSEPVPAIATDVDLSEPVPAIATDVDLAEIISAIATDVDRSEPDPAIETGINPPEVASEPDPLLNYFAQDAVVVETASKTVLRSQDDWQPRQIIIQKLYSESLDATWANAYVPDGTYVFIREQESVNDTLSVQGMVRADGADYFWVQSGITSGNVASQACVSVPTLSFDAGHTLYDPLCTDFSVPPYEPALI